MLNILKSSIYLLIKYNILCEIDAYVTKFLERYNFLTVFETNVFSRLKTIIISTYYDKKIGEHHGSIITYMYNNIYTIIYIYTSIE